MKPARPMQERTNAGLAVQDRDAGRGRRLVTARGHVEVEEGMLTVQFLAAAGLSLITLTILANLIVFQYGRGVVRAALDEGARAGSRATAGIAECERRAAAVLDDLLGGSMQEGVRIWCEDDGAAIDAIADVTFQGWVPTVPDWSFIVSATAHRETYT